MTGILNLLAGAVGVVKDTYFNLVTLLLPGDGTNGAQNNTFLDSSTNNFTITRNGNTTQGTFSPFSQTGWGNFFGGTLSYFTAPSNAAFNMGAGDFTVELFAYDVARNSSGTIWVSKWGNTASVGRSFVLGYMSSTNELFLYGSSDGTTQTNIISTTSHGLNLNTWNHIAATRSGNTFRLFVNGSLVATATNSITLYSSTTPFCVGANYEDVQSSLSNFNVNGYISNLRILKGTAQYTSAFTPPVSPLTAITNTSLLTCQSNRFIDNSSNAFAITVNGTPSVQAFSPFAPTAAYSASTVGGSGYFDGTGDYLNYSPGSAFAFGTGDFTVEGWAYFSNATNEAFYFIDARNTGQTTNWCLLKDPDAAVFWFDGVNSYKSGNNTITQKNTWYHVAYTRSGTTGRIFINGVQTGGNFTDTTNYSTSVTTAYTGCRYNQVEFLTGYFGGIRVVKGTALYTSNFTPPTTPFTAVTNTSFLLNFTNAGITDATAKSDLETVGTTQISTTQKKFGTASLYFDGTNNTSRARAIGNLYNLGTTDFTVEFWYYPTSHNTTGYPVLWTNYETWIGGAGYNNLIGLLAGNKDRSPVNAVWLTLGDNYWQGTTTVPSLNTWTHVALVRTGNRYLIFINGTKEVDYTATSTITFNANNMSIVGGGTDGAGLNRIYGYIDDFRQTNYARYTANFTPPTQSLPLQ